MAKLELAAERLTNALNALEASLVPLQGVRADAGSAHADADNAKARLAELNAERERLLARIAELEDETQILGEISEEVEGRLDDAIGEIRAALGR